MDWFLHLRVMLSTLCNQRVSHIGALSSSAGRAKLAWVTASAEVDRLRCAASRRCAAKILLTYISRTKVLFRFLCIGFRDAYCFGSVAVYSLARVDNGWGPRALFDMIYYLDFKLLTGSRPFLTILLKAGHSCFKTEVDLSLYLDILMSFGVSFRRVLHCKKGRGSEYNWL